MVTLDKHKKFRESDKGKSYRKTYYENNKEKLNETSRKHAKTDRAKISRANRRLRERYSITLDEYNIKLEQQDNVCAICGVNESFRRLAVDHDHKCCSGNVSCGKCVRGLLCGRCNVAMGIFDRVNTEKILEYLNTWQMI